MKHITLVMLEQAKACDDQRLLFKATFGKKAELTTANMAKAIKAGLNFDWLDRLLTQPMWRDYMVGCAPMLDAYRSQVADLSEACTVQMAGLREVYVSQRDSLRQNAQKALLLRAYTMQIATLREVSRVQRVLLWKVYKAQRNTLLLNTLLAA